MKIKRISAILLTAAVFMATACGKTEPKEAPAEKTEETSADVEEVPEEADDPEDAEETEVAAEEPETATPGVAPEVMLMTDYVYETAKDRTDLALLTGQCSYLVLTPDSAEQFPELAAALDQGRTDRKKAYDEENASTLEIAQGEAADNPEMFSEMQYSSVAKDLVQRADAKILSFREDCESFSGGAHGNAWANGYTYAVDTGKQLTLRDVLTDTDGLAELIRTELLKNYDEETFFGLEESLAAYDPTLTREDTDETDVEDIRFPYTWYLTSEGIAFYFAPYALAPYAMGDQQAVLRFADYPELFTDAVMPEESDGYIVSFGYKLNGFDINGDGTLDEMVVCDVYGDTSEYMDPTGVSLSINADRDPALCGNYQSDCTFDSIDLLENADEEHYYVVTNDGRQYVYVLANTYNDWKVLLVFDLNDDAVKTVDEEFYRGVGFPVGEEDYGYAVLTDPAHMPFANNFDLLATFSGMRYYTVGENGMPSSNEQFYVNRFAYAPGYVSLVLKTEIQGEVLNEDGTVASEETLPVGTEFRTLRTDGETILDILLSDGRIVRLPITKTGYPCEIGGIEDSDLVETCWYAG